MSEFLAMGGYATAVWGSYAAAVLVLLWNLWAPVLQRRTLLRRLRARSQST